MAREALSYGGRWKATAGSRETELQRGWSTDCHARGLMFDTRRSSPSAPTRPTRITSRSPGRTRCLADNQVVLLDLWGGTELRDGVRRPDLDGLQRPTAAGEGAASVGHGAGCARRGDRGGPERRRAGVRSPASRPTAPRARVIEAAGFGEFFVHRTGHSIDRDLHGSGPHLDDYETHDDRDLVPGVGFSVEPGIYLPGEFGVRSEVNMFWGTEGRRERTPQSAPQVELHSCQRAIGADRGVDRLIAAAAAANRVQRSRRCCLAERCADRPRRSHAAASVPIGIRSFQTVTPHECSEFRSRYVSLTRTEATLHILAAPTGPRSGLRSRDSTLRHSSDAGTSPSSRLPRGGLPSPFGRRARPQLPVAVATCRFTPSEDVSMKNSRVSAFARVCAVDRVRGSRPGPRSGHAPRPGDW